MVCRCVAKQTGNVAQADDSRNLRWFVVALVSLLCPQGQAIFAGVVYFLCKSALAVPGANAASRRWDRDPALGLAAFKVVRGVEQQRLSQRLENNPGTTRDRLATESATLKKNTSNANSSIYIYVDLLYVCKGIHLSSKARSRLH